MDNCRFGLCPYPPKGLQPYRSELNEAFCRGQQTLLSGWLTGLTAPWQTMPRHPGKWWQVWWAYSLCIGSSSVCNSPEFFAPCAEPRGRSAEDSYRALHCY